MTTNTRWRKSSYSGGGSNECVELAHGLDRLRDSKNPSGPVLAVDVTPLVAVIKEGRFS